MGDIYDFFTKKKIKKNTKSLPYRTRIKNCLKNIDINGKCECDICKDKATLSNKLFDITRYLAIEHATKTGKTLYVADVLEIVLVVAARIKNDISKK